MEYANHSDLAEYMAAYVHEHVQSPPTPASPKSHQALPTAALGMFTSISPLQ